MTDNQETDKKPIYRFGLKRSKLSENDKVSFFKYEKVELPTKFSLSDLHEIHIFNQGELNSCSANAISNQIILSTPKEEIKNSIPSRLYIYFNSRLTDQTLQGYRSIRIEDEGASLKASYEGLSKHNWLDESLYPYIEQKVNAFPQKEQYLQAARNKSHIKSYRHIIPQLYSIKYILAVLKKPICLGMSVFESFCDLNKDNYILRKPEGMFLGLHAVLIFEYNDETQTVGIINSHGKNFGLDGTFQLAYNYLLNPDLCFEMFLLNS